MNRHRHQWSEAGRVFAPPTRGDFKMRFGTQETMDRLMFGVTSIELRCDCGDVAERQLLGDHVSQGKSRLRG